MKITKIEILPVSIPIKSPKRVAFGVFDMRAYVFVKIHTDEGVVGVGETSPWIPETRESQEDIIPLIEKWLGPAIIGEDPFQIQKIWKIIRSNFGLEEYDRLACRFHFLKPTMSLNESEMLIERSELNVSIPEQLKEPHYDLNIRQVITIFEKEDIEYRIELKGITRTHSIDPTSLYKARPETLSKNQKEYRLQKIKRLAKYSSDPMYAVMLDIDCVKYNPEQISLGEHIKKQTELVRQDFLPILEKL